MREGLSEEAHLALSLGEVGIRVLSKGQGHLASFFYSLKQCFVIVR